MSLELQVSNSSAAVNSSPEGSEAELLFWLRVWSERHKSLQFVQNNDMSVLSWLHIGGRDSQGEILARHKSLYSH